MCPDATEHITMMHMMQALKKKVSLAEQAAALSKVRWAVFFLPLPFSLLLGN